MPIDITEYHYLCTVVQIVTRFAQQSAESKSKNIPGLIDLNDNPRKRLLIGWAWPLNFEYCFRVFHCLSTQLHVR